MFHGLDAYDSRPLSEEGVWFPLRDLATGDPLLIDGEKLELKLAGPDSKAHKAFLAEHARRIARIQANSKHGEVDPEDRERALAETLPGIVLEWRGFRDKDKKPMPLTRENVTRLFTTYRWAALQADGYAGMRANFFPTLGGEPSLPPATG